MADSDVQSEGEGSWENFSVDSDGFSEPNASDSSPEDSQTSSEGSGDEIENICGAEPYRFEPLVRGRGDAVDDGQDGMVHADENAIPPGPVNEDRLGTTDWCTCGNCIIMDTAENCKCCKEVEKMTEKIRHTGMEPDAVRCFTEHPWYEATCLNPGTLETAYFQYRQQYGARAIEGDRAAKYRHVSYRQVVRWCWGYLGRNNRVRLPSCIVMKVRETYPDADGNYTGFKFPDLDE